jgi:DNA-binding response OmpR family regulator
MLSPNPRILYVDDDIDSCEVICWMLNLEDERYATTLVSSAFEAITLIENQPFDLFILDYALPEMSGVDLCRRIRCMDSQTPVMFYSAMAGEEARRQALTQGATEYLVKPDDIDEFCPTVKMLLNESRMRAENRALKCLGLEFKNSIH